MPRPLFRIFHALRAGLVSLAEQPSHRRRPPLASERVMWSPTKARPIAGSEAKISNFQVRGLDCAMATRRGACDAASASGVPANEANSMQIESYSLGAAAHLGNCLAA